MVKKSSPEQKIAAVLGRPKLIEGRVPFTTSLTSNNKKKLEVLATLRKQRKADLLNDVLAHFFDKYANEEERKVLLALD